MNVFEHAVLGPGADRVAARTALDLAKRGEVAVVLADLGSTRPYVGLPATRAARRIARRLDGQGVWATARGRLVLARAEGALLVAVARRAAARCACPVVLALTAPRDELTDVLLVESGQVSVVADPDGSVAALALEDLLEIGIVARIVSGAGAEATLAPIGWPTPRWLTALGRLAPEA